MTNVNNDKCHNAKAKQSSGCFVGRRGHKAKQSEGKTMYKSTAGPINQCERPTATSSAPFCSSQRLELRLNSIWNAKHSSWIATQAGRPTGRLAGRIYTQHTEKTRRRAAALTRRQGRGRQGKSSQVESSQVKCNGLALTMPWRTVRWVPSVNILIYTLHLNRPLPLEPVSMPTATTTAICPS